MRRPSAPTRPSRPFQRASSALGLASLLAALFAVGCNRTSADAREWTPSDHDQPPSAQNAPAPRPQGSAAKQTPANDDDLVELAWQKNCTPCHGQIGKGDGPQGAMMRALDLTLADWQGKVSDAEMGETIRKGRNRMPAFPLPPQVIDGLIKRIRANKGR